METTSEKPKGAPESLLESALAFLKEGVERVKELDIMKQLQEFAPEIVAFFNSLFGGSKEKEAEKNPPSQTLPGPTSEDFPASPPSPKTEATKNKTVAQTVDQTKSALAPNPPSSPSNIVEGRLIDAREGSRVMKYAPCAKAIEIIKSAQKEESFVEVKGDNMIKKARESAGKAFELAQELARREGYEIGVSSAKRTSSHQASLAENVKSNKWIADPGKSWHQSGGAMDVYLVKDGKLLTPLSSSAIGKNIEEEKRLEKYMNLAGFVRYSAEPWHFEFCSKGWAAIMKKKGYVDNPVIYDRDQ